MRKVPLKIIKEYFDKIEFTDDVVKLDQCTTITNLEKFYKSHIEPFSSKQQNKRVLYPYYIRLLKLYYLYTDGKVQ